MGTTGQPRSHRLEHSSHLRVSASEDKDLRLETFDALQLLSWSLEQRLIFGLQVQAFKPCAQNPDLPL